MAVSLIDKIANLQVANGKRGRRLLEPTSLKVQAALGQLQDMETDGILIDVVEEKPEQVRRDKTHAGKAC